MTRTIASIALAGVLVYGAACERRGSAGDAAGDADAASKRADVRIVMVTHGQSSDPFWSVVVNGARAAAADLGVRLEYQAPTRFDMVEMSGLIDAAVATKPSGLVVSIPDAAALGESIRRAVAAGIPVLSINSGAESYAQLGVLAHIGQTEYEAGHAAGERLGAAGARAVLCVNHEVGNAAQDERCRGAKDGLGSTARLEVLAVDLANPDDAQQRISGALRRDATFDAVLTLGSTGADPALAALRAVNAIGRVRFATFDLSPHVLDALKAGDALFAVDQQQYLQGYLPVTLLTTYRETLALPGGGKVILTGPGFVTRDNAERVIELTARGVR